MGRYVICEMESMKNGKKNGEIFQKAENEVNAGDTFPKEQTQEPEDKDDKTQENIFHAWRKVKPRHSAIRRQPVRFVRQEKPEMRRLQNPRNFDDL